MSSPLGKSRLADSGFAKWCEAHGIEYSDPVSFTIYSINTTKLLDLASTSGFACFENTLFEYYHEDEQHLPSLEGHKRGDVLHQMCGWNPKNGEYHPDNRDERGFGTEGELLELEDVLDNWYAGPNIPDSLYIKENRCFADVDGTLGSFNADDEAIQSSNDDGDDLELLAHIENNWHGIPVFAVHNFHLDNPLPAHFGLSLYYNQHISKKEEKKENCRSRKATQSWPKSRCPATPRPLPPAVEMVDISEILRPWTSIPIASPKSARDIDVRRMMARLVNAFPKEERAKFIDVLKLNEEELYEEPNWVERTKFGVVEENGGKIKNGWFGFSR